VNAIDWKKIDWDMIDQLLDEIIADDYTYHHPSYVGFEPGTIGNKKWIRQVYSAVSDIHVTIEDTFGESDKLATRLSLKYVDLTTGKPMNAQSILISYFRNGKITDEWEIISEHIPIPGG
jgi:ketosteroid isomerase-like protein